MNESWIQALAIIASNLVIMLTFFGVSISLHIRSDTKIEEHRKETSDLLNAIHEDMKDFHGKLERQDAEFKAFLMHGNKNQK